MGRRQRGVRGARDAAFDRVIDRRALPVGGRLPSEKRVR